MKNKKLITIVTILVLAILLTSCTGAATAVSWGGVTVADSAVYFASGPIVYAINKENGNTDWSFPESVSATRMFLAAPTIAGEQLLVGDYSNLLTSLDINTGNESGGDWPFKGAKGKYIDSPLVVEETVVAPNSDGHLYALDLDGNLLWTYPKSGEEISKKSSFWAQPVNDENAVFAPNMDHFLYAVDLTTGKEKWKAIDLKASLVARPLLVDGVIYLGNLDGDFFAVDSQTSRILWEHKVAGGVWAAPVFYDGKLYFGDQSGDVNILNASNGSVFSTFSTKSAILGSGVILSEDGIVFGKEDGELVLIGFDGQEDWTRTIGGSLYSNISINGDLFAVVSNAGEVPLVAFDIEGKKSWDFTIKK